MSSNDLDISRLYLSPLQSIREAASILSSTGLRIVLVVDQDQKLLGVITDSDLRKAIVKGIDMNASVGGIMATDPILATEDDSKQAILHRMRRYNVHEVPRVNSKGQVVKVELFHAISEAIADNVNVLIMAGGLGKRLRPLTLDKPKPLLPVRGVPMIERILKSFSKQGFKQFYISLCYRPNDFIDYFKTMSDLDADISWLIEETPLGTAGAISLLPQEQRNSDLIVSNADLDADICYQSVLRYHRQRQADITIAAKRYAYQIPFGVIDHCDGRVQSIEEKPEYVKYINGGLYVLSPSIYSSLISNKYLDMPGLIADSINQNKQVAMYPLHEYWSDIGRIGDYNMANEKSELCRE